MTNHMMNDPKAIAFTQSLNSIVIYDSYREEFKDKVLYASGTKDIDKCVANIVRRIAVDADLVPSTETLTGLSYSFIRHCAEMSILTQE